MPVSRGLARLHRKVRNPVARSAARTMPGYAVISHKGRKSGRGYETVVNIARADDLVRIAIRYGRESDWVRNILAAGEFTLVTRGQTLHLADPVVRSDPASSWGPLPIRLLTRVSGTADYLECRITKD